MESLEWSGVRHDSANHICLRYVIRVTFGGFSGTPFCKEVKCE